MYQLFLEGGDGFKKSEKRGLGFRICSLTFDLFFVRETSLYFCFTYTFVFVHGWMDCKSQEKKQNGRATFRNSDFGA